MKFIQGLPENPNAVVLRQDGGNLLIQLKNGAIVVNEGTLRGTGTVVIRGKSIGISGLIEISGQFKSMGLTYAGIGGMVIRSPAQTRPSTQIPLAELPTINYPDVEAVIASIPADMWPRLNLSGQERIEQSARFKAWSDTFVRGRSIDLAPNTTRWFRLPGRDNIRVEVRVLAKSVAPKMTKLSLINNNGVYTATVQVR
jgi:hypothetical protein